MPEPAPRFSVVVPAYNSMRTIEATLDSILAQTVADLELIVVDDGSSDQTPEFVRSLAVADPRVRLIEQANARTAAARNTGIAAARADLVSFLDHDDLWLPGYLEAMNAALDRHPEAGFAFTDAWLLDEPVNRFRRRTALEHYPAVPELISSQELLERLVSRVNFVMSSATVRRVVLEKVDGFDAGIRGVDDWDIWIRIAAAGYPAAKADGCQLIQRDHPTSQSKDDAMMFRSMGEVLELVAKSYEVSEEIRSLAREQIVANDADLGAITGQRTIAGAVLRARSGFARMRGRLRGGWLSEPPEEIRRHLPELGVG